MNRDKVDAKALKAALGRFGHHPDSAIDFCIEVEALEGEWANTKIGFANGTPPIDEIKSRIEKAMQFRVGGDPGSVHAKHILRGIEAEARAYLAALQPSQQPTEPVEHPAAAFDFLEALSERYPQIKGCYARGTGGIEWADLTDVIRAALIAPPVPTETAGAEPVAWRWRGTPTDRWAVSFDPPNPEGEGCEVQPLYASLPNSGDRERARAEAFEEAAKRCDAKAELHGNGWAIELAKPFHDMAAELRALAASTNTLGEASRG